MVLDGELWVIFAMSQQHNTIYHVEGLKKIKKTFFILFCRLKNYKFQNINRGK